MSVETVFLTVLVIALGIGNILLSLFFEEKPQAFSQSGKEYHKASIIDSAIQTSSDVENASVNQKFLLVSRRLADIDAKIHKLDNFRGNTQVELKGIMEILAELQDKNVTVKAKKFEKKEPQLSTQQMHQIIYRSR